MSLTHMNTGHVRVVSGAMQESGTGNGAVLAVHLSPHYLVNFLGRCCAVCRQHLDFEAIRACMERSPLLVPRFNAIESLSGLRQGWVNPTVSLWVEISAGSNGNELQRGRTATSPTYRPLRRRGNSIQTTKSERHTTLGWSMLVPKKRTRQRESTRSASQKGHR